jgi:plasmid maintenance system antidote protein VapI
MEKVKKLVDAGASIPLAIKAALEQSGFPTVAAFAEQYGLSRASVANHINGVVRAADDTIDALIAALGGTREEWRELLWLAGKPAEVKLGTD